MQTVQVDEGQVLTVIADPGSYGTVFRDGTTSQWTVGAKAPLRLGPGTYHVETVKGTVKTSVDGKDVAAIAAALPAKIENIVSERIVTAAIVDGLQARRGKMALKDKAALLADRARSLPGKLNDRMDRADARLTAADSKAGVAFDKLDIVIDDVEASAQVAEDVANQLTNGLGEIPNV